MTREEYLDKVLYGLRRVDEAIFEIKLLNLAYKILMTEECTEDNFDVVSLLVDSYRCRHEGLIDEIKGSLLWAKEYLKLPEDKEIG